MTEQRYDEIAKATADLTNGQREQIAQMLVDDRDAGLDLAYVLADQAGLTSEGPSPSLLVVRIDKMIAGRDLTPDKPTYAYQYTSPWIRPAYAHKPGGRHCSCGVARLMISEGTLPHKDGCPEAVS